MERHCELFNNQHQLKCAGLSHSNHAATLTTVLGRSAPDLRDLLYNEHNIRPLNPLEKQPEVRNPYHDVAKDMNSYTSQKLVIQLSREDLESRNV